MSEVRYYTWLSQAVPKGSIAVNHILERYDSVKEFYEAVKADSKAADFISPNARKGLLKTSIFVADEILNNCERLGINVVCCEDEDYPKRLLDIDGIPPVLYYVGDISLLNERATIGVVGTRKPLDKSKQIAGNICSDLAKIGIAVVSGCALGIDEYAHRGAIKARGKTVGVLGCGVDVNYPRRNARIKNKLLRLSGALISEQPPGTKALPANFPCRNRLLAGLSDSVFVVEAPLKSGSLITADHATNQGKEVFCLPPLGFRDKRFSGCVKYLRSGAIPVYDVTDILYNYYISQAQKLDVNQLAKILESKEQLPAIKESAEQKDEFVKNGEQGKTQAEAKKLKKPIEGVSEPAKSIYDSALSFEPRRVGELSEISGMPVAQVLSALTELEITGAVAQKPGGMYYIPED